MRPKMRRRLRAVPAPELTPDPSPEPAPSPPANGPVTVGPFSIEVVDVTPELATRWLEKNHPNNRPVAWNRVGAFANDMRSNAWKLTHQGVCFDGDGHLIDGQHRLQSVLQATVTVQMLVIRTTVGDFHDPIDRVGPRSVGTIMGVTGRDVSCLNMLRMMETGFEIHTPLTVNEAEGIQERHRAYLEELRTIPGRGKLTGPVQTALVWALPCGRERTIDFATRVASGEMIGRGHPAWAFRRWRELNKRAESWDTTMAALNALRHYLNEAGVTALHTGVAGYRAFCSKRRALRIPHTPAVDIVPSGNWAPSRGEREGGAE